MIALFVGYFLIVKKFTNNFKENNEFTVSSLIGLFILSLVLTFALPGASYLTVFPDYNVINSIIYKNILS